MAALHPDHIGGGRVVRSFNMGSERVLSGKVLTREQIVRMPHGNRNALIEKGFLAVWPPTSGQGPVAPQQAPIAKPANGGTERFVCALGFGRYDVVEGRKV